jgi:DNA polymerase-3 subunit gamma/tau
MGLLRLLEVEPVQSLSTLLDRLDTVVAAGGSGEVSARAPAAREASASRVAPETVEPALPPPGGDWSTLVARVRSQRPALASLLEHGRPLRFGEDGVEIGYPKGTFYLESAQERDNRALLERVIAEHFGKPVPLAVAATDVAAGGVQTLAESAADRQRRREREIRDGALEHPAVQDALAVLGGEVKEVIPLGNRADESAS